VNIEHRAYLTIKQDMRREIGFRPSYAAVYEQLFHWQNAVTGLTCPAQGVLARALGYCRETVNRACAWLEAHGYIKSQQRYRRLRELGSRFLSKRYWVAKDTGQVALLLARFRGRAMRLCTDPKTAPRARKFSCDLKITPPSRTELNPEEIERLKRMFQLRWNE